MASASPQALERLKQGLAHHRAGRLAEAIRAYRGAVAAAPFHFDALYLLGLATAQSGDMAAAADLLKRACGINPHHADAQFQHASALMELGRAREAEQAYARAVRIEPRLAPAQYGLGRALDAQERLDEAIAAYRRALSVAPGQAGAAYHLGNALMRRGEGDAAITAFRQAVAHRPDHARAHANLGAALELAGRSDEALPAWREAVHLEPARDSNWSGFARALEGKRFTAADPALADDLRRCLTHSAIDPQVVAAAVTSYLSADPRIAALLRGDAAVIASALACGGRLDDALLHALLEQAIIADPDWERLSTMLRRSLLARAESGDGPLELACALARQCFATEYVFATTADEDSRADALAAQVEAALRDGAGVPPLRIAVTASYRPLHRLAHAARLAEGPWPEALDRVVDDQVRAPAAEMGLREAITRLTPIDDDVSRAVQAQYEENPYPRWRRASSPGAPRPLDDVVRMLFPAAALEPPPLRTPPLEMLIAGCGTGRQVLGSAARFTDMRVLAVDLSLTSLAYAARKTREAGAKNIEYAQADLLALGALGRRFDLIECGGVLHHLRDPLTGWRVLEALLKPGGYMRIALYSARARRVIGEARDFIASRGFGPAAGDIRRCRQEILAMGDTGFARRLRRNPEFYSVSACRDLLFHVQEHHLTLPQIAGMLAALGLDFLGFEPAPPALAAAYRARFPDDAAMTDLARWDALEAEQPDAFAAMYQFWVRKPADRSS